MWKFVAHKWPRIEGATGMVSEGQGMAGAIEGGLGAVMISSLVGAFFGLIVGFMVSHLMRFFSMSLNRNLGGASWVIFGAVLGAALFAFIAINAEKN
jgi:hypothetical protein